MEHAVWVNLPERGANVKLVGSTGYSRPFVLCRWTKWRAALLLKGIPLAEYLYGACVLSRAQATALINLRQNSPM